METEFVYYEVHAHGGPSNISIICDTPSDARFLAKCIIELYEQVCHIEILEVVSQERIEL